MGLRFRRSIKIAPGVKLNLNKKSASVTLGGKRIHHTVSSTGRKTTSVGIPGTGISYSKTTGSKRSSTPRNSVHACPNTPNREGPRSNDRKWYEKNSWIIFFLIFFFPVGLYLMWKSKWKKGAKISVSFLYVLGAIFYLLSPKLETISLKADTSQIYDINSEVPLEISTTPDDYSISSSYFNLSGGKIEESDGKFIFSASEAGEYTLYLSCGDVESDKITITFEDKAAILKAEQEAAAKAEAERIAQEQAEAEKAAQEEAEKISQEQAAQPQEEMVWIAPEGQKYHKNSSCGRMNPDTAQQITLSEAESRGLDACKKCY